MMGKLKLSHECNRFPLPPNQLYIELTGESIKFLCEGKEIKLKTNENMNYNRVSTKINMAIDMLFDCIELS